MALPGDEMAAEGDDAARLLIVRQAALAGAQRSLVDAQLQAHRLELVRARVGIALQILLLALLLAFAAIVLIAAIRSVRSDRLVIMPFDVPGALALSGATGEALAASVADELRRLNDTGPPLRSHRQVIATEPRAGASIVRMFGSFGPQREIGGSVIRADDGILRLTVRGDGIEPWTFTGRSRDLPRLAARAAGHVYGSAHPAAYIRLLLNSGRSAEASEFAPRALNSARNQAERATIAAIWAQALARLGRSEEAQEQVRHALSIDPASWRARAAQAEAAADDETALVESGELRRRLLRMAPAQGAGEGVFVLDARLRQDWTELARIHSRGGEAGQLPLLAEAEAHRHDHQSARRSLLATDPGDPLAGPLQDFTSGLRELDLGRADRAVGPLERFDRAVARRPELGRLLRGDRCFLALAYARLSRSREAMRLLDAEPGSARCAAFRGDVLALGGQWGAASRAYREAIRLAPSSPVPFERAAAALFERDDLDSAVRLFEAAIRRGPRWADPRFGLGEAMMRMGRFSEAERQYRAAIPLAPRWGALHLAWGDALWRLDRQREARAAWRAAAGMDITRPERARLDRLLTLEGGALAEILG